MKYFRNKFANSLALLALIGLIFKAFIAKELALDENLIERAFTSYILAYLAFKISYMETRRVALIFIPLLVHSLTTALVVRSGFAPEIFGDMVDIITSLYRLMVMVGVFFILELSFNKILGSLATSVLGGISFLIFLAIVFTKKLEVLTPYKDFFLYFSFYVMAIRVRAALRLNPALLVLALALVAGEVYLREKYIKINYGFFLSIFPLAYLSLKTIPNEQDFGFLDYIIFALIYIYPALFVIIRAKFAIESLAISIIALLASYILGEAIYKIKNTYLSYLLLGIN